MENPTFQPEWLTDEVSALLARITGPQARKKRATVLRLAEGAAIGRSQQATFKLKETCSPKTWDGQYRNRVKLPGWKDDPDIRVALAAATKRAQWWQDQAEARRIAQRQELVARARDKLSELSFTAALKLGALLGSENPETARKAANDILDRADEATASKSVIREEARSEQVIQFDFGGVSPDLLRALADAGTDR